MFHIAICDDEDYFLQREKELIKAYMKERGYGCRIDVYPSGKELLDRASALSRYDAVFLDISMEEMDGIETAKGINRISTQISVVFVTAYMTWALEGYKVGAVRYLLKEGSGQEAAWEECLDTITDRMRRREARYEVDFPKGKRRIAIDTILYAESRLHRVLFHTMEDEIREYYKYGKLDLVEKELEQYGFVRVHQSYLVNMNHVRNVERYTVSFRNGTEVNVSKRYYKDVEKAYILRQGEV